MADSLPILFRRRFIWKVRRATNLTAEQRSGLIEAADDDEFLGKLLADTKAKYGDPGAGWLDWLKSLPWLQIISIALSLFMLFLGKKSPVREAGL